MSFLSFLNPGFLGALALGSIPILIHLIRRRKVRVQPWAAWEFLKQSKKKNRRRLRIEQFLLMLLRILIVCLVVLAFCRPVLNTQGFSLIAADSRIHAVIVLDNSFSMGYKAGADSDFDKAKRIADDLLSKALKRGDSASVVLASSRPEAHIKDPTFDLGKARERVRAARPSDLGTEYANAAALVAEMLRKVKTPVKEVYWITDNQRVGFPDSAAERSKGAFKQLAAQARITWINVTSGARPNARVEPPTFSRELITPRAPVRIEALIRNHSSAARSGALVTLTANGKPVGSDRVDLPANGSARAQFTYLFERAGVFDGVIKLNDSDGLSADDSAYFAARVRERLTVLVVNPTPASDVTRDEAFYLATALTPNTESGAAGTIKASIQPGMKLASANLNAYDAVVIAGLQNLDPANRRALAEFVRAGGGALIFPSPTADQNRVNAALTGDDTAGSLLPARLGSKRTFPAGEAASLNPASIEHPALAPFRDTSEINLGSARFTTTFDLNPDLNDDTVRVLCRFTGGEPALVEKRIGQGRLILCAAPAGAGSSDLPYKAAFVPLIHQLAAYISSGPSSQRSLKPGEPITARFDVSESGKPIRVTEPGGAMRIDRSILGPNGVIFTSSDTWKAGIYRVGTASEPNREGYAVNLPVPESDLSSFDNAQIQAAAGGTKMQFANGTSNLVEVIRKGRQGTEIWRTLILIVIPLLFLEALLAQRFGRRG
jgi:hypothetical protein